MKAEINNSLSRLRKTKKRLVIFLLLYLIGTVLLSQEVYDNFEGNKLVTYNLKKAGKLDSAAANPTPDKVNNSPNCAFYTRSRQRFDNIKMTVRGKLTNVNVYATHAGNAKKIKMKIYTTAPVGTLVEIHLGKSAGNAYPEGTHSQYQAFTSVSGKWEELEFKFSQVPTGSKTAESEVNQVTLLFNPYINSGESFYFDDLTGPLPASASASSKGK